MGKLRGQGQGSSAKAGMACRPDRGMGLGRVFTSFVHATEISFGMTAMAPPVRFQMET